MGISYNFEKTAFIGFLLLIAWSPLPFASNRSWAISILEIAIFIIFIFLCIGFILGNLEISHCLNKAKPAVTIFLVWLGILLLQIIPLPLFLVELISPARLSSFSYIDISSTWIPLSENIQSSIEYFIQSIAYVLFFIISLQLLNSRKRVKLLAYTLIYCALLQAMYGSLMTLSGIEYGFFVKKEVNLGVATGTFINRNHLAGYLNMGIAVTLGLLISRLGRGGDITSYKQWYRRIVQLFMSKKTTLRIYIALMTITLVLTHSRMGNATILISLTLTSLLSLFLTQHARKMMVILTISIIVIDISIISSWYGLEKVATRIEQTVAPQITGNNKARDTLALAPLNERSVTGRENQVVIPRIERGAISGITQGSAQSEVRYDVFLYTAKLINDYLYLGSGGGTYQYVFPKYRGPDIRLYFDHAHNDFLEIASETGVIGFSVLLLSVLITLFTAIKALSMRKDPLMIGMAFASIMGILSIMIHSAVDFNLQIPANAMTFILLLALSWVSRFMPKQGKTMGTV